MENPKKITTIGGQALMEGIMMVGPKRTVAAFCDEEGNISTEEMAEMTYQVDVMGRTVDDVAQEFLVSKGLLAG